MKELKDYTLQELVDEATRYAHDGLLNEGGKGLKSAIRTYLSFAIQWSQERNQPKETNKSIFNCF